MVGGRQRLQVWGGVSRAGLHLKKITLAAGEEEIGGTSAGWRTGGQLENSGIVRRGGGSLEQGSNSGDGENWKDPWSGPGGSTVRGAREMAGRAGDHTSPGARKGVRPQGLSEGSMARKLGLPLSSANTHAPPSSCHKDPVRPCQLPQQPARSSWGTEPILVPSVPGWKASMASRSPSKLILDLSQLACCPV